ncbi:MAG: Hpt domain-containing protein [Lachnospiraceae bacterium]|nr:Hpt domain-containing protein [Lachnospiraceae bacterium]
MSLQECYKALEGDYEGVASRLRSEKMIRKFVLKFLNDASYQTLLSSLEEKNYEEAFRASHTIKGVCQNLGFTRLGDSSSSLTDALRDGWSDGAEALVEKVKADYELTVNAIRILEAESEG